MKADAHLHLHLFDFEVGGTEQWAVAMGAALQGLPLRRSITAGVRLAGAAPAFAGWEALPVKALPPHAYVIAPYDIPRLVTLSHRVIAVAHGMNDYYTSLFAGGGYMKAVAVSAVAAKAFPAGAAVDVVHNGIDLQRLEPRAKRAEVRADLRLAEDALVIGHVGRLSVGKSPLAAARAAARLRNGVALYVGPRPPPEQEAQMRALAECRFLPPGSIAMGDAYRAMDVCLVASRTEGFSLVTVEAWACGAPVVSTPVGVSLEHPECVVAVPTDADPETLAAAVRRALAEDRRPALEAARELALTRYSLPAMAARWRAYLGALPR